MDVSAAYRPSTAASAPLSRKRTRAGSDQFDDNIYGKAQRRDGSDSKRRIPRLADARDRSREHSRDRRGRSPVLSGGHDGRRSRSRQDRNKMAVGPDRGVNEQALAFRYGNFDPFHGYNPWGGSSDEFKEEDVFTDHRLDCVPLAAWQGARVLDVGCGAGYTCISLASTAIGQRIGSMLGVDLDDTLVQRARGLADYRLRLDAEAGSTARSSSSSDGSSAIAASSASASASASSASQPPGPMLPHLDLARLPMSLRHCQGIRSPTATTFSASGSTQAAVSSSVSAPKVTFRTEDFVAGEVYTHPPDSYEVVTCLNVTKYVHLNSGDKGLLFLFRRIHQILKPGGYFVLQAQPWQSYTSKAKAIGREVYETFRTLRLRPDDFLMHLLSKVGFRRLEALKEYPKRNGEVRQVMVLQK